MQFAQGGLDCVQLPDRFQGLARRRRQDYFDEVAELFEGQAGPMQGGGFARPRGLQTLLQAVERPPEHGAGGDWRQGGEAVGKGAAHLGLETLQFRRQFPGQTTDARFQMAADFSQPRMPLIVREPAEQTQLHPGVPGGGGEAQEFFQFFPGAAKNAG